MRNRCGLVIASLSVIATAGCAGANSTTAATPSTAARTTDTFTGAVGGSDVHGFTVAVAGTVDVTLTAVTPAIMMGMSVGTTAIGGCVPLAGGSTQAAAGSAAQLSGVVTPGTLCVDVHDAGFQSSSVSYTVTVTHP